MYRPKDKIQDPQYPKAEPYLNIQDPKYPTAVSLPDDPGSTGPHNKQKSEDPRSTRSQDKNDFQNSRSTGSRDNIKAKHLKFTLHRIFGLAHVSYPGSSGSQNAIMCLENCYCYHVFTRNAIICSGLHRCR